MLNIDYNSNKQELESCMRKAVVNLGLRDILARHGVPSEDSVMVHLSNSDEKILASQKLESEKTNPKTQNIASASAATGNLRDEIVDFLDRAEDEFGLLSSLSRTIRPEEPDSLEETLLLTFECGSFKFNDGKNDAISLNKSNLSSMQIRVRAGFCCGRRCCKSGDLCCVR